jgi:hypothetical protein
MLNYRFILIQSQPIHPKIGLYLRDMIIVKIPEMMNLLKISIFIIALGLVTSCADDSVGNLDDRECLLARYQSDYCPANERLGVIQFLEPSKLASKIMYQQVPQDSDSSLYLAAVLDLPESVLKSDTTFYIKVRRDLKRESTIKFGYCPAIYGSHNILVCEEISEQPCPIP